MERIVGTLTVRLSDDLHAAARQAAGRGAGSLSAFVREAVAEKVARSALRAELDALQERVERLERAAGLQPRWPR